MYWGNWCKMTDIIAALNGSDIFEIVLNLFTVNTNTSFKWQRNLFPEALACYCPSDSTILLQEDFPSYKKNRIMQGMWGDIPLTSSISPFRNDFKFCMNRRRQEFTRYFDLTVLSEHLHQLRCCNLMAKSKWMDKSNYCLQRLELWMFALGWLQLCYFPWG